MNSSSSSRKCNYSFILSKEFLKVFFKPIHIRAERNDPVGIKCFLYKLLFIARKVAKAEKNSILSFFHIVKQLHFLIQILPSLFVLEVRDELFDCINYLSLGEIIFSENTLKFLKKGIYFSHLMASCLLNNT